MKNLKKFISVLIIFSILLTSCAKIDEAEKESPISNENNKKIVATWITYYEIKQLVEKSDNIIDFESMIYEKIQYLKKYSINNIFIHVRAFDDCFYKSSVFPVSVYCSDDNGELKFDVLQVFINVCHSLDIKVHAWINPYRIRNDGNISKIHKKSYAYQFLEESSEKLIISDSFIYYNPSCVEINSYILSGIREILDNYYVDGIHIDDYFYPTTNTDIDDSIYAEYIKSGGLLSIDDYRRECVNSLVASIYSLVKSYNSDLVFSISPSGDINKNYNELFADVTHWMNSIGYVDYIIPQIYYGYNNENMPFERVLNEWMSKNDKECIIIIGLGLYKSGKKDIYAGNGINEWLDSTNIIARQIKHCFDNNADGIAFYSFSNLLGLDENRTIAIENENIIKQMELYVT